MQLLFLLPEGDLSRLGIGERNSGKPKARGAESNLSRRVISRSRLQKRSYS